MANTTIETQNSGSERQKGHTPWHEVHEDFDGIVRFNKEGVSVSPFGSGGGGGSGAFLKIPNTARSRISTAQRYTMSMWFKIDESLSDITAQLGGAYIRMALFDVTGEHELFWRFRPATSAYAASRRQLQP